MDFPSDDDLFQGVKNAILVTPGLKIDPRMIDVVGSDINIGGRIGAAVASSVLRQLVISDRARYLDSATGVEIDRLGFDWYGLVRKQATAAIGFVQLTRAVDTAGPGTIAAGSRFQVGSQIFELTNGAQFGSTDLDGTTTGALSSANIPARAELIGAASGVPASPTPTTWTWVDAPFDPTIQIANSQPFIGDDGEPVGTTIGDASYKARIRAYFPSIQKGVLQAIQNDALTVAGVAQAEAVEVTNQIVLPQTFPPLTQSQVSTIISALGPSIPFMWVNLYIGDVNGNSNDTIVGLVQQALISARSAGVFVQVIGATPVMIYVSQTGVAVPVGVDPLATQQALQAAIIAYINSLAPGATIRIPSVYAAEINAGTLATIPQSTTGALTLGLCLAQMGAVDLVPTQQNQVFRTQIQNVTVTG